MQSFFERLNFHSWPTLICKLEHDLLFYRQGLSFYERTIEVHSTMCINIVSLTKNKLNYDTILFLS